VRRVPAGPAPSVRARGAPVRAADLVLAPGQATTRLALTRPAWARPRAATVPTALTVAIGPIVASVAIVPSSAATAGIVAIVPSSAVTAGTAALTGATAVTGARVRVSPAPPALARPAPVAGVPAVRACPVALVP
jgi:hypothetical protein